MVELLCETETRVGNCPPGWETVGESEMSSQAFSKAMDAAMGEDSVSLHPHLCERSGAGCTTVELDPNKPSPQSTPPPFAVVDPNAPVPTTHVPVMRMIAVLVSQGKGEDEIALLLNLPVDRIRGLVTMREFTNILSELPDQTAVIDRVLQGTVLGSINTLRNLRDNPTTPAPVRLQACKLLLEHAIGSPEAKTRHKPFNPSDTVEMSPLARAQYLEEQLKQFANR